MAEDDTLPDNDGAARLLALYASKPPKVNLSGEEKRKLSQFVRKNKDFRKVKDIVRLEAWARSVPMLNEDASSEAFVTRYARNQGFRDGMLFAIDRLEEIVAEEDEDETDDNDSR